MKNKAVFVRQTVEPLRFYETIEHLYKIDLTDEEVKKLIKEKIPGDTSGYVASATVHISLRKDVKEEHKI